MEAGDPSGDTQALVPYSLYNPFQDQLRCEDRMITIGPTDLHVKQAWQAGGRGGTDIGFGASVYDSSIVLSLFVNDSRQEFEGKVVLELGCGPGLVSLAAGVAGCKHAVMTDGDSKSVQLGEENAAANGLAERTTCTKLLWGDKEDMQTVKSILCGFIGPRSHPQNANTTSISHGGIRSSSCSSRPGPGSGPESEGTAGGTHACGDEGDDREDRQEAEEGRADIILASDVAALPYAHAYDALIDTMYTLCKPGGCVYLTYQRRHASEDDFFVRFRERFDVDRLPRSLVHRDFRRQPIYILKATPRRPRREPGGQSEERG